MAATLLQTGCGHPTCGWRSKPCPERRNDYEALLRTRGLLAFAPHRVPRARHSRRAEKGRQQDEDDRRWRRFPRSEPARLRTRARARRRPDSHRGPRDRAVSRRPEARRRPCPEGGHHRALPAAGVAALPPLGSAQAVLAALQADPAGGLKADREAEPRLALRLDRAAARG